MFLFVGAALVFFAESGPAGRKLTAHNGAVDLVSSAVAKIEEVGHNLVAARKLDDHGTDEEAMEVAMDAAGLALGMVALQLLQ